MAQSIAPPVTVLLLLLISLSVLLGMNTCEAHPLTLYTVDEALTGSIEPVDVDVSPEEVLHHLITRALVDQPANLVVDIAYPEASDDDLVLAETHVFRPLFAYRQQVAKRMRLKNQRRKGGRN